MKKLFASLFAGALLLLSVPSHSQVLIGAGYLGSSDISVNASGNSNTDKLNGFYVGAGYNYNIVGGLGVSAGLFGTYLAGKDNDTKGTAWVNATNTIRYVEFALNVPLYVSYKIEVGDLGIFAYAGPAFQYGLLSHSTATITGNIGPISYGTDKPFVYDHYKGNPDYKLAADQNPFNVYISVGAGVQLGSTIQLIFGYEHNLTNMTPLTDCKLSRSQFHVGVGVSL